MGGDVALADACHVDRDVRELDERMSMVRVATEENVFKRPLGYFVRSILDAGASFEAWG